jgi:hypothetical protein
VTKPALLKQEVQEKRDQEKIRAAKKQRPEARTPLPERNTAAGWFGMYLDCKTCLQLWAEYASATRRMWTPATPTWEAAEARIQTACEAVTVHAAEPH